MRDFWALSRVGGGQRDLQRLAESAFLGQALTFACRPHGPTIAP